MQVGADTNHKPPVRKTLNADQPRTMVVYLSTQQAIDDRILRIKQSLHASLTAPLTPQAELRLSGQRASRTRNTKHVFVKIIERVRGVDSS